MPRRYKSLPIQAGKPWKNALTLWEIAWAAPQVIAHRTARMALAGPQPDARDQAEFTRMWQEKAVAFSQAAMRSGWEALRLQQSLGMALLGMSGNAALTPFRLAGRGAPSLERVWSEGLRPIHARATANARRLKRARLSTKRK